MRHTVHTFLGLLLCCAAHASSSAQTEQADTAVIMLRDVTVDGVKKQISYRTDRQKVNASSVLSAQGGTALDILKAIPGVTLDSEGNLSYRGSQNFMVYVDGNISPLSGSDALRMIAAGGIREIELLTTPGARYKSEGDAGIINIVTNSLGYDGWDINVSGTADTWGSLGIDGKLSYRRGRHLAWIAGQGTNIKNKSVFEQEKITEAKGERVHSYADGTRFRRAETYTGSCGYEYGSLWHHLNISLLVGRTKNPRGGDMLYSE